MANALLNWKNLHGNSPGFQCNTRSITNRRIPSHFILSSECPSVQSTAIFLAPSFMGPFLLALFASSSARRCCRFSSRRRRSWERTRVETLRLMPVGVEKSTLPHPYSLVRIQKTSKAPPMNSNHPEISSHKLELKLTVSNNVLSTRTFSGCFVVDRRCVETGAGLNGSSSNLVDLKPGKRRQKCHHFIQISFYRFLMLTLFEASPIVVVGVVPPVRGGIRQTLGGFR